MNPRDRIEKAQAQLGLRDYQMAELLRITPEWYSKIMNSRVAVSDDLALRLDELVRRKGIEVGSSSPPPAGEAVRYVPIVSWTHAGDAVAYEEIPLEDRDRVATMSNDPRAFAIIVEGESMLPDYKPGDRVIVAPSRDPRNGKPVVAKLEDDGIVLRIFHRLNTRTIRLSSLRPDIYPAIDYAENRFQWLWPVEELNRRI